MRIACCDGRHFESCALTPEMLPWLWVGGYSLLSSCRQAGPGCSSWRTTWHSRMCCCFARWQSWAWTQPRQRGRAVPPSPKGPRWTGETGLGLTRSAKPSNLPDTTLKGLCTGRMHIFCLCWHGQIGSLFRQPARVRRLCGIGKQTGLSHHLMLACRPRGWLPKGISGVTSVLGYIPIIGAPTTQPPPTEAEMQELYKELDYHPHSAPATSTATTSLTIKLQVGFPPLITVFLKIQTGTIVVATPRIPYLHTPLLVLMVRLRTD